MSEPMVAVKISQHKLMHLFRIGALCAADIQCLDIEVRDVIQKLCLQTCSEKICAHCSFCDQCASQKSTIHCALPSIHQALRMQ